jgi:dTDP-glucose 4,6-dehydratase
MNREFQNILVTGGSGFIGSNFIHSYLRNNEDCFVINIDKLTYAGNNQNHLNIKNDSRYKFIHGDICNEDLVSKILDKYSIEAIVNFAAESHVDRSIDGPNVFINTNIIGTFNLLKCSLKHYQNMNNFLFMHVSTDEVYGSLTKNDKAFTEETKYAPNSPYSASKASSDHLARAWFHTYSLPIMTTNCSNNYGPYQFPEKLIPLTIYNALNSKPIKIYGNGKNIRDWLYVEDHCKGIQTVMKKGKLGEVYNIGGLNEKSNIEIVNKICEILDKKLPKDTSYKSLITFVEDRKGHDFRYAINQSKIIKELGWSPEESFETGIEKTVNWYINNMDWVNPLIKKIN